VRIPLTLAASFVAVVLLAARPPDPTLAIVNVTVIDGAGTPPRPNMTVLVDESRIASIDPSARAVVPADTPTVEGRGKFLIPALWDMHTHVANTTTAATADVILPMFTAYGIVAVRDMGGDFARIQRLRMDMRQRRVEGPLIITPGPFVDGPQPASPIVMPVSDEEDAKAAVKALIERGVDFIKVQSGLSHDAWRAVATEAKRRNIVFAGHVPEAVSASEVVGSGQASIEHISPALPGDAGLLLACSSKEDSLRTELRAIASALRQPNADRAELRKRQDALQTAMFDTYDEARATALFRRMVKENVVSVPTLIWSQTQLPRSRDDLGQDVPLQAIPALMRNGWLTTRRRTVEALTDQRIAHNKVIAERSIDLVRKMHDVGVTILAGTDSFDTLVIPGYSLHQELELLVAAGFSPMSALYSATRDAARFFKQDKDRGTIAKGKMADMLLLDADPLADIRNTRKIAAFIKAGDVLTRADLDAMIPAR
jgi:imidazolonepropionase-like amidohydrolase